MCSSDLNLNLNISDFSLLQEIDSKKYELLNTVLSTETKVVSLFVNNSSGTSGVDILIGTSGNDNLSGGYGDDVLTGGTGNDILDGSYGSDTYIFNLGDGVDVINDSSSGYVEEIDKIIFGEGITKEDLIVRRESNHLVIEYSETDKITINNWFYGTSYQIERFEFADGTVLVPNDLMKYDSKVIGTTSNETLYGMAGNDVITGNGGTRDNLYGYGGDDVLTTLEGNDNLYGGVGNDTLNAGAGNDYLYGENGTDIVTGKQIGRAHV